MSLEFLADPNVWLTLITLSALEIVLGIDNLVFISITVGRLPEQQRPSARRLGIAVACITRIALLVSLAFLARMQNDLFSIAGMGISIRDLVLILGGIFLLVKGIGEIRELITGGEDEDPATTRASAVFGMVILQIAIIDIVFSLDSVFTAVGLARPDQVPIMVTAIIISILVMMLVSGPISDFVEAHPTVKVLALAFLIMVGGVLVAEGFGADVPKGYLYSAMAFSVCVEMVNLRLRKLLDAQRKGG
jgi:predicted tellurium resistance membrane protein TerC